MNVLMWVYFKVFFWVSLTPPRPGVGFETECTFYIHSDDDESICWEDEAGGE